MMKKLLALLLVVVTVAGFMVPVHAAENSGRMSLEMIGPAHMDLDDEIIDYGIYVSDTNRLATITVEVELDPYFVSYDEEAFSPWVEGASGWTIINYRFKEENGKIRGVIVASNFEGLTTKNASKIFTIRADSKGKGGLALASVTGVEACVYVGDESEAYCDCNLPNRVTRTVFGDGGFGGRDQYTFRRSVQLGLIEPWFLRANRYIRDEEGKYLTTTQIDNYFVDYGFYFIRKEDVAEATVDAIVNDPDAVLITKADGAVIRQGSLGGMVSADFDEGIYTYELDTSFYVLFYMEDTLNRYYDTVQERNILSLASSSKNNTGFDETERAVYRRMEEMFTAVTAHRATFESIPDLPVMSAPKVEANQFKNYMADLTLQHSANIVLIEPWGLKLNGKVAGQYADYGLVVSTEPRCADLRNLITDMDTHVFSLSNGHAEVSNGTISGVYNKGIYTYQLDQNLYVAFFVKDSNGMYHFGPVRTRNILSMVTEQAANTARPATERAVYEAMVNMHTDVMTHRARFGLN